MLGGAVIGLRPRGRGMRVGHGDGGQEAESGRSSHPPGAQARAGAARGNTGSQTHMKTW